MAKMKFYATYVGEVEIPDSASAEEMEDWYPGAKSSKDAFDQQCAFFKEDFWELNEYCEDLVSSWGVLRDDDGKFVSVEMIYEGDDE
jgi:hypothetical protein